MSRARELLDQLIAIPEVPPKLVFQLEEELMMRERRQTIRERQVRCREMKEARLSAKWGAKNE